MSWGKIHDTKLIASPPHEYSTYKPLEMKRWLADVAKEYVSLRTECTTQLPSSLDLAGIGVVDVSTLKSWMAQMLVPDDDTHRKGFSVSRSDLSEVAAYLLLERRFGTQIAFKLVRDRELPQLPGRGIDAIGIEQDENGRLSVILGEIKFSDEDSAPKPPQVVEGAKDCMRVQQLGHVAELKQTIRKIWDCARRAKDPKLQELLLTAAAYLQEGHIGSVDLVSCCILVRPEARHAAGDFGKFKKTPADFAPAHVRFLVWVLPGEMDGILSDWVAAVETERAAA